MKKGIISILFPVLLMMSLAMPANIGAYAHDDDEDDGRSYDDYVRYGQDDDDDWDEDDDHDRDWGEDGYCDDDEWDDCEDGYSTTSGQYYYNDRNCRDDDYGYRDRYRWSCDNIGSHIPEGAVIRARGGIDVFIVKYSNGKKFKRLVLNPSVFEHYGHLSWDDVMDVDAYVLECFATSDLVRSEGSRNVFRLYPSGDYGTKRLLRPGAYSKYYVDQDSIYTINRFDEDSYVWGRPLD